MHVLYMNILMYIACMCSMCMYMYIYKTV